MEISHKSYLTKVSTDYCRKHRKFAKFIILHNRIQNSEKFSLIISKLAFSQVPQQLFFKQAQIALTQIIKAAIVCPYAYCEGNYGKVLQTRTIVFTGVKESTDIPTQNTKQINLACITNYYKNISLWLILLVQKAAFPLICSTCRHYQTRENIQQ